MCMPFDPELLDDLLGTKGEYEHVCWYGGEVVKSRFRDTYHCKEHEVKWRATVGALTPDI